MSVTDEEEDEVQTKEILVSNVYIYLNFLLNPELNRQVQHYTTGRCTWAILAFTSQFPYFSSDKDS